ncbi:peptidoglycan DD-metalloendopeptidase family protein [candidate division WOR-3 bacterium]|uniref:Peptidoglycan DD-metalloendopeptidase family protein n=1 Tax=candidate division WOR-3 bacterium TaxID=2052148 RepID=A0A9D5QCY2_UNCW3|nr:peptidoglycan DD-metalloendopeptidase family protein [candidate division WOR-3 bacterium]MBD3364527.1 peptidoglycan DD-metalloendopeptidase family protein [candidate division WOR-3 bacterium]
MLRLLLLFLATLDVSLSTDTLKQGEILYVSIGSEEPGLVSFYYRGDPYHLLPFNDRLVAMIGTSYHTNPGRKDVRVVFRQGMSEEVVDTFVQVVDKNFRKSVITLPPSKQRTIDASEKERKQREYEEVVEVLNARSGTYYSLIPEMFPCARKISGTYGDERWTNGRKLWHHSGLDIAVAEGTPILAPCAGVVVMARDTFIRQGTFVILDHGMGLKSLYYHMIEKNVENGDIVKAGDTLGFAGSTGIATGPHLHMGLYVHGVPVDPLFWLERKEPF